MTSLQGYILVASPQLQDPNFHRSLVLIVQHNDEGALGLILNRQMETTIDMVWHQVSDSPCICDDPLYHGGPCDGMLMVLHGEPSLAQMDVLPGVYFTADKDAVEHLVADDEPEHPVKFFVGYSGWSEGQLEAEIASGAWLTAPALPNLIFQQTGDAWDLLRRRITLKTNYPWLNQKLIPDDPTVN